MHNLRNFDQFIFEASLKGNPGLPGEGESRDPSWLNQIKQSKDASMRQFFQENQQDIRNFMGLVNQSQQIQRGKEEDLSALAEDCIRSLFGSLLDDIKFDFKIGTPQEIKQEMEPTPDTPDPSFEEITDEKIKNEIHARKILRTIQQGKGLTSKAILNLPMFKKGIEDILGRDVARTYVSTLNKISNVAGFNDWTLPDSMITQFLKMSSAGASSIDFEDIESEEDKSEAAQNVISDLNSEDALSTPDAEEVFDGVQAIIRARGLDLSVLLHEIIKSIYMLATQLSLEHLSGEEAEQVLMNTDTLSDEPEEFKYGPEMQKAFYTAISEHPDVKERIERIQRYTGSANAEEADTAWNELGAFEEQLYWMIFGKLATYRTDDRSQFLEVVYSVLIGSKSKIEELFYPIIEESLAALDSESEYQSRSSVPTQSREDAPSQNLELEADDDPDEYYSEGPIEVAEDPLENLSKREIEALIDNALDAGDFKEVERLSKYLKESVNAVKLLHLKTYENYFQVFENVKAAKEYFVSMIAKKKGIQLSELTPEQIARIESDPEFNQIKNLTESKPNLMIPFIKFRYEQDASMQNLETIFSELNRLNAILNKLPMQVTQYSTIVPDNKDFRPGWERLLDDLTKLEDVQMGLWLPRSLVRQAGYKYPGTGEIIPGRTPIDQKALFNAAPKEVQDELISVAAQLNKADDSGKLVGEITRKMSSYSTLEQIKTNIVNKIDSIGTQKGEVSARISELYPGVVQVYEDNQRIIAIFRSPNALGELCRSASWCIIPRQYGGQGMWYSYGGGDRIQYVLFDFGKSASDPMSMVGYTPYANGSLQTAHRKDDESVASNGENILDVMRKHGVPEEGLEEVKISLKPEVDLNKAIDPIYRKLNDNAEISKVVDQLIKGIEQSVMAAMADKSGTDSAELEKKNKLQELIIAKELSLNPESGDKARQLALERFYRIGCTTLNGARIFKLMFEGTPEFNDTVISKIIGASEETKRKLLIARQAILKDPSRSPKANITKINAIADTLDTSIAYLKNLKSK
jgi:hypothetical protein